MAINSANFWSGQTTDIYDGQRYYSEQERRYREEMERQRNAAMQNTAYNPYFQSQQGVTDLDREQQAIKPKQPVYTMNKKLLLLEN